jgi:hypothetical protein
MCYRTAAAQQAERSRVLNSGILILLIPPILVLAGILLLAVRRSRSVAKLRDQAPLRRNEAPPGLAHTK